MKKIEQRHLDIMTLFSQITGSKQLQEVLDILSELKESQDKEIDLSKVIKCPPVMINPFTGKIV